MRFDHIGVVVKRIAKGRKTLTELFAICDWTEEFRDPVNGIVCQFGRDVSGFWYELIEPLDENSPVYLALTGGHAILNHVAYRVGDLSAARDALERQRCARTADPKPAIAYGGRLIQFFVTPLRFVVELVEAPDHEYLCPGISRAPV